MINEVFKTIPFSDGLYEVSNYGRVKSCRKKYEFYLKQWDDINGYKRVGLTINGVYKQCSVHYLVAYVFLSYKGTGIIKNGNSLVIDHIDNNKTNNNLSNLQIITHAENIRKDRKSKESSGVHFDGKKYNAYKYDNGKKLHLGRFNTFTEAKLAVKNEPYLFQFNS